MANSSWFKHDSNASFDPKILELRAACGWEGVGIFWAIVERLREADSNRLANVWQMLELCLNVPKETAKKIISVCLDVKLLVEENSEIYSPGLCDRVSEYDKIVKIRKHSGKLGGLAKAKQNPSKRLANAKQNPSDLNRSDLNRSDLNRDIDPPTPGAEDPPIENPEIKIADSFLEEPDGQLWTRTSCFLNTGRRPMKIYPNIFLTAPELSEVFKLYTGKIPKAEWKRAFKKVDTRIRDKISGGGLPENCAAGSWLLGWAYQAVIDDLKKEKQFETAEVRANVGN